jgi:hypothetical protein
VRISSIAVCCRQLALFLVMLVSCQTPSAREPSSTEPQWTPLFNGRDLSDWTVKIRGEDLGHDPDHTFRVEDGLLSVGYEGYESFDGRFGHLFHEGDWSHYRLRVEYRFVGRQCPGGPGWALRNSGVMLHGQTPGSMGRDQEFPVSIEVQFLGGDGDRRRPTANLCTPGTHVVRDGELLTRHCTDSTSATYHGDQWVTVEIEVRGGGSIRHIIDGEVVLAYETPQLDPGDADAQACLERSRGQLVLSSGSISLQSESHPVQFRRVEILVLDPAGPPGPAPTREP